MRDTEGKHTCACDGEGKQMILDVLFNGRQVL